LQPLDQGIIACTKAHYRQQLVQWVIAEAEKPANAENPLKELHPNFYQMMRWLNTAWKECVPPSPFATAGTKQASCQRAGLQVQVQTLQEQKMQPTHSSSLTLPCKVCVRKHGALLPNNDAMLSANEFHELDGEREVFKELDDAAIVQMIQSDIAVGVLDSDEDEADDFVDMSTTKAQVVQLAGDLHEFALAQPQLFHASDVAALQNMRNALANSIEDSKSRPL
jgi:hypothetical protein